MQTIDSDLQAVYDGEVATLARCILITRVDGEVYGFTSLDRDLVIGGVTYETARGFMTTDIGTGNNLDVDSSEVTGALHSESITEDDLRAGLWDYAAFRVFEVNYEDLTMGERKLRKGRLGQVRVERNAFHVETLGLMQQLSTSIGSLTSPGCRNQLGDARCGVVLNGGSPAYTFLGTITLVDADTITLEDTGLTQVSNYFQNGLITFDSGANDGIAREVKSSTALGVVVLQLPFPYVVQVGDTFSIAAGCNKRLETCRDKFANVVNFNGEPYLPGNDKMLQQGRRS